VSAHHVGTPEPPVAAPPEPWQTRQPPARRRSAFLILVPAVLVPLGVAAVVYLVANTLPATYESSAQFRVTVPNQAGLTEATVMAANDLATQYSQLAGATTVVNAAARALKIPPAALSGEIAGGTVNAQNLVQVTASTDSPGTAQARASAVANALRKYIDGINARQSSTYSRNVTSGLLPLDAEIARYTKRLNGASVTERANINLLLGSLLSQRQQVLASTARDTAAGRPTLQGIASASTAVKTSPRPKLYALVALVAAALIAGRIAFLLLRRRGFFAY
jgi:capsular polysaccharide biosynthesis protein